jgi:hypothetical protein
MKTGALVVILITQHVVVFRIYKFWGNGLWEAPPKGFLENFFIRKDPEKR